MSAANVHPAETAKFDRLAARWWDVDGESRPLHDLNPARVDYIAERVTLRGARVLDVGCGGGILSESLARAGARVTGIDLAPRVLEVARLHLYESQLEVDYRQISVEALAVESPAAFDAIACMEMLEHVPDPASIVRACATLVRPGGTVFFSTLNRNPKSWLFAVIGAEYVLRLLPRGTHEYEKMIKPSELARDARDAGLREAELMGMSYNPFTKVYSLGKDTAVNYLMRCVRDE